MRSLVSIAVLVPLLAACGVPQAKYDAAVKDASDARDEARRCADDKKQLEQRLGIAVSKATSDQDRAELEELRKAHEEEQARAKELQDLVDQFKTMIDAGTLKIIERHGRLVLQLSNDVLFDPFKTDIKPEGNKALVQIAQTLKTLRGRRFQVAGHTDVVVIHTKEFPSNWELSTGRAIAVVKLLVNQGVDPHALSAAGYSLYDPVGRDPAHNRRIEITLVPHVEGLLQNQTNGK